MLRQRRWDDHKGVNDGKFPEFTDGDVKISLRGDRQYQLHSQNLKNASPVLRNLLNHVGPAPLSTKVSKKGIQTRYKLVLVPNTDEDVPDVPPREEISFIFKAIQINSLGHPIGDQLPSIPFTFENGKPVDPRLAAFDAVLGAFYNIPIDLGDPQEDDLSDLLVQACDVVAVAAYLHCEHIVRSPIESTLLATGQTFFKAISTNPVPWLRFAYKIQSKTIFREALIHATGQVNDELVAEELASDYTPEEVRQVVRRKVENIKESVSIAERHLASYYPTILMREATVGNVNRDNIGRANYANDIMMWIALSTFRHWCCDMMAADNTHHAPDLGYAFMKCISMGGNAYLSKSILQSQFHQRFPMSPKGMACVEHRLIEIKEVCKQWGTPLMECYANLDIVAHPVDHFTCVRINNNDFPWLVNHPTSRASPDSSDGEIVLHSDDPSPASAPSRDHLEAEPMEGVSQDVAMPANPCSSLEDEELDGTPMAKEQLNDGSPPETENQLHGDPMEEVVDEAGGDGEPTWGFQGLDDLSADPTARTAGEGLDGTNDGYAYEDTEGEDDQPYMAPIFEQQHCEMEEQPRQS